MKINKKTKKFILLLTIVCFTISMIFLFILVTYQYSFGLLNIKQNSRNKFITKDNISVNSKKRLVDDANNDKQSITNSEHKKTITKSYEENPLLNKNYIGNYSIKNDVSKSDVILIGTLNNGLFISKNGGRSYGEMNKDIFRKTKIIRIEKTKNNKIIIVTKNSGIFTSNLNFTGLRKANKGLPHKVLVENDKVISNVYRDVTNFASNTDSPDEFFLSTKYAVYHTNNLEEGWKLYTNKLRNINCIDFNRKDNNFDFLLGTSIRGLYRQKDFNGKLRSFDKNLTRNGSIVEELSTIYIDHDNKAYTGFNYKNRLFKVKLDSQSNWQKVNLPFKDESHTNLDNINDIRSISTRYTNNKQYLTIVSNLGIYETSDEQNWRRLDLNEILNRLPQKENISTICIFTNEGESILQLHDLHITPYVKEHCKKTKYYEQAKNRRGLYFLTHFAKSKTVMNQVKSYIKNTPMNSVVIDMKDDSGRVRYKSNLDVVKKVGSVSAVIDIEKVTKTFEELDVYVIARIVLFKDKKLYNYKGGKYAVKDGKTGKPWAGHKYERWVDPYSEFVWDYNISIAKELVSLGVDEVQFDYARFPTDGKGVNQIRFDHQRKGMTKKDALESFFRKARKNIDAPLSIDIYGRNGWYQINDRIGQDPEMLAEYVDVICPMFYPSHFGSGFLNYKPYKERPLRIYYYGGLRASSLVDNNAIVRPYVQAFKISSNSYDKNYYNEEYIMNEIKGCDLADKNGGYTFWNAGNKYSIVQKAYDLFDKTNSPDD